MPEGFPIDEWNCLALDRVKSLIAINLALMGVKGLNGDIPHWQVKSSGIRLSKICKCHKLALTGVKGLMVTDCEKAQTKNKTETQLTKSIVDQWKWIQKWIPSSWRWMRKYMLIGKLYCGLLSYLCHIFWTHQGDSKRRMTMMVIRWWRKPKEINATSLNLGIHQYRTC